jgi:hypothetical protein
MNYVSLAPALFGLFLFTLYEAWHYHISSWLQKQTIIAVIVVKLLEHLGHGHTVWMACFCNSPELAQFMKSKTTGCRKLHMLTEKMLLL